MPNTVIMFKNIYFNFHVIKHKYPSKANYNKTSYTYIYIINTLKQHNSNKCEK